MLLLLLLSLLLIVVSGERKRAKVVEWKMMESNRRSRSLQLLLLCGGIMTVSKVAYQRVSFSIDEEKVCQARRLSFEVRG